MGKKKKKEVYDGKKEEYIDPEIADEVKNPDGMTTGGGGDEMEMGQEPEMITEDMGMDECSCEECNPDEVKFKAYFADRHDLNGKILLVKVGDGDRPARKEDLDDMVKIFQQQLNGIACRLIVTHHAVEVSVL